MATIEGKIERGESLVAIQSELRLKVRVLEDFNSSPGASASLTVRVVEVLQGSLPSHIDELTLNANGWDLYRADDASIPETASKASGYSRLIGGLTIFSAYGDHPHYVMAEHDVVYAGPSPEVVSESDLRTLTTLGWIAADTDNFYIFV